MYANVDGGLMSSAELVIRKMGGLRKLARALEHRNPTTVQGWKARGNIPARHQPAILEKAAAAGVELSPADFLAQTPLLPTSTKGSIPSPETVV